MQKLEDEPAIEWRNLATIYDGLRPGDDRGAALSAARSAVQEARSHDPVFGRDAALLLDIDLAILGAAPARFDEYERQVRAEYAHVAEADFRAGRARVLAGFLARPRLYATEAFHGALEQRARANLARSLATLLP